MTNEKGNVVRALCSGSSGSVLHEGRTPRIPGSARSRIRRNEDDDRRRYEVGLGFGEAMQLVERVNPSGPLTEGVADPPRNRAGRAAAVPA